MRTSLATGPLVRRAGLVAVPLLVAGAASAQIVRIPPLRVRPAVPNLPPVIEVDAPGTIYAHPPRDLQFRGEELRFTVTVHDPEGDPVSVRLTNPPAGLAFQPASDVPSPWGTEVRWLPTDVDAGQKHLVFEASDGVQTTRLAVPIAAVGPGNAYDPGVSSGDVTGDGKLDLLVTSATDVYVWAGATEPSGTPSAVLSLATVGATSGPGSCQLADLDLDGILDVAVAVPSAERDGRESAGAVLLFYGGPELGGVVDPDAILDRPFPKDFDGLGRAGVHFADVTGDGALDVITGSIGLEAQGVNRGGALVWAGGERLEGEPAPTAVLIAGSGSQLTQFFPPFLFADLTGDGVLDVLTGNNVESRAVLWTGGAALTGNPAPSATLDLGFGGGVTLADVTGDGALDVLCASSNIDAELRLWHGPIVGSPAPTASLVDPLYSQPLDGLGSVGSPFVADVTGDGVLDVMAAAREGTNRLVVWAGGAGLVGTVSQTATFLLPGRFGGFQSGWLLHDLDADGTLDVLVEQDGVQVFLGGGTLTRHQPPDFALETLLGSMGISPGTRFGDVTGDGVPDIVASYSSEEVDGVPFAGAIMVHAGGPGVGPAAEATATLTLADPQPSDYLGSSTHAGPLLADVTGDGVLDVVVAADHADIGGVEDAGAVFVWAGGAGLGGQELHPTAVLAAPNPSAGDQLSRVHDSFINHSRHGMLLGDVSGDGIADVVVGGIYADTDAVDAGEVHVWLGGASMTGAPAPVATVSIPSPTAGDWLGLMGTNQPGPRQGLHLVDLTGDGLLDVVAGSTWADPGGTQDAGEILLWSASWTEPLEMTVPGAPASNHLGR